MDSLEDKMTDKLTVGRTDDRKVIPMHCPAYTGDINNVLDI